MARLVKVPPVSLPDLDGNRHPLPAAWADGYALIAVVHSDCETSRFALPYLDRIHRRRGPDATVLAILQDESEVARGLVKALGLGLPVRLEDDPYPTSNALGLTTVPTLMLVGLDGRVESFSEGFRRADLEDYAARLGVTPPLFTPEDAAPALKPG